MTTYIIESEGSRIHGADIRFKLLKIAGEHGFKLTSKSMPDNKVSFTVKNDTDIKPIVEFIKEFRPDATVKVK